MNHTKMKIILSLLVSIASLGSAFAADSKIQNIPLSVTEKGFEPSEIKVKPGSHVILNVTRLTDETCATQIKIKEMKIKKELPLNKVVNVDLGVLKNGDIKFACGMDMMSGHVITQ